MISRHRLDDGAADARRGRPGRASTKACSCAGRSSTDGVVRRAWRLCGRGRTCRLRAPLVIAADGAQLARRSRPGPGATCAPAAPMGRWRVLRGCCRRAGRSRRRSGAVRRDAPATGPLHRHCAAARRGDQRLRRDGRSRRAARSGAPPARHAAHRSPARRAVCRGPAESRSPCASARSRSMRRPAARPDCSWPAMPRGSSIR